LTRIFNGYMDFALVRGLIRDIMDCFNPFKNNSLKGELHNGL